MGELMGEILREIMGGKVLLDVFVVEISAIVLVKISIEKLIRSASNHYRRPSLRDMWNRGRNRIWISGNLRAGEWGGN